MNAPGCDDSAVAAALADLGRRMRESIKGLDQKVVCRLYGTDCSYLIGGEDGASWDGAAMEQPAAAPDWECFVLAQGGGSLQGRQTGRVIGRASAGVLEENREQMHVHQLLPAKFSDLKAKCALPVPSLTARAAYLKREPFRGSAVLFFQTYLRSVYRSASGVEEGPYFALLEALPGEAAAAEAVEFMAENEHALKKDRKSVVPEIREGRIRVVYKDGKKKVLVNGWLFGEPETAPSEAEPEGAARSSHYERTIGDAAFFTRMKALLCEAELLLGEGAGGMIGLVAEQADGRLAKTLAAIAKFSELAEANMLDAAHAEPARALLEHFDGLILAASRHPRFLEKAGVDLDAIKAQQQNAMKLKRKLSSAS